MAETGFQSNVKFRDREEEYDGPSEARIGSQIEYMSDSLSKLAALVESLQDRIDPILLPEEPANMNAIITASPPRKPASEVSNTIDDLNGQISRIQRMVGSLAERVQL